MVIFGGNGFDSSKNFLKLDLITSALMVSSTPSNGLPFTKTCIVVKLLSRTGFL